MAFPERVAYLVFQEHLICSNGLSGNNSSAVGSSTITNVTESKEAEYLMRIHLTAALEQEIVKRVVLPVSR